MNTVKLTPKGELRLDGHVISFEHDCAERLGNILPHPDLDAAICVMFVGTSEDYKRKRPDVLKNLYPHLYDVFHVDAKKLPTCLEFLKAHNPFWSDIEFSEENVSRVRACRDEALENARMVSALGIEINAIATSDIAHARPHDEVKEDFVGDVDGPRPCSTCFFAR